MILNLEAVWSRWPLLAVAAALILLPFRFGRPDGLSLPRWKLLLVLRWAAGLMFALAVLAPVLVFRWNSHEKPLVLVGIDASASLSARDAQASRFQSVLDLLGNAKLWDDISKRGGVDLRWVSFGRTGRPLNPSKADSVLFADGITDISTLFENAKEDAPEFRRLAGVVLVSDGLFNSGPDPEQWAASCGVPFHCIAVGDSVESADLSIERLDAPATAMAGSVCRIRIQVKSNIPTPTPSHISLFEGKRLLSMKRVSLSPGLSDIILEPLPHKIGTQEWAVAIEAPDKPERNMKNNARRLWIDVLKSKIRVAALFQAPCLDQRFFQRALALDPHIVMLPPSGGGSQAKRNFIPGSLADSVDVLVFHNWLLSSLGEENLKLLRTAVAQGKGLILLGNSCAEGEPLADWIPCPSKIAFQPAAVGGGIRPTLWGRSSQLLGTSDADQPQWDKLPAIPWYRGAIAPGSTSILESTDRNGASPLLFWKPLGRGKILAYWGAELWPWSFSSASGSAPTDSLWPLWVRWVAAAQEANALTVSLDKRELVQGENLIVSARLHDPAQRPVQNADVDFELRKQGKRVASYRLSAVAETPGVYELALPAAATGEFAYVCTAHRTGGLREKYEGTLTVIESPVEWKSIAARRDVLRRIAALSGGRYYEMDDFKNQAREALALPPVPAARQLRLGFGVWPSLLVWIGLLLVEWLLRRLWRIE